jgi:hypothetical protein
MEETMRILLMDEAAARLANRVPFPAQCSAVPVPGSDDVTSTAAVQAADIVLHEGFDYGPSH